MRDKKVKSLIVCVLVMSLVFSQLIYAESEETTGFKDVKNGHWAEAYIVKLKELEIVKGKSGNYFGLGDKISRAEFVTMLVNLTKLDETVPELTNTTSGSFNDNQDNTKWYFKYIEDAVTLGIINGNEQISFRPLENITRIEIAEMIINTLDLEWYAELTANQKTRFQDVTTQVGYVELLADFDIVSGKPDNSFDPLGSAKREEAAAILVRMYNLLNPEMINLNGFYAIESYKQRDLMSDFNQISFGWADMKLEADDLTVSFRDAFPDSYEIPLGLSEEISGNRMISIYGTNEIENTQGTGMVDLLLKSEENKMKFIDDIMVFMTTNNSFDGVTIDFENISTNETKEAFNSFIGDLSIRLETMNKDLAVMVQPLENYNYDYKTIGEYADQVILMAHDYNAKSLNVDEANMGWVITPLTPFDKVYKALKDITDEETGVADTDKISLQFSMDTAQWGVNDQGRVSHSNAYRPTYDLLYNRLIKEGTRLNYGETTRNPFAEYHNDIDELDYTIWYEDSRSIEEKIKLAKLFGIHNFSIWRLGNIPDYKDNGEKKVYLDHMDILRKLSM